MILSSRPLIQPNDNYLALFNELMVSSYLYLLLQLTDFIGENSKRDEQGTALLAVLGISITVNLGKFGYSVYLEIMKKVMRKRAIRMALEEREKQNRIIEVMKNKMFY